jgi:hypothetical protein
LARPGDNLTGVSLITTELDAKRLGLLAEFAPSARRLPSCVGSYSFWHSRSYGPTSVAP